MILFKIGDYGRCTYLADEQAFGGAGNYSMHGAPETATSFYSDVWAIGVMLFELMSLTVLDSDANDSERAKLRGAVGDYAKNTDGTWLISCSRCSLIAPSKDSTQQTHFARSRR